MFSLLSVVNISWGPATKLNTPLRPLLSTLVYIYSILWCILWRIEEQPNLLDLQWRLFLTHSNRRNPLFTHLLFLVALLGVTRSAVGLQRGFMEGGRESTAGPRAQAVSLLPHCAAFCQAFTASRAFFNEWPYLFRHQRKGEGGEGKRTFRSCSLFGSHLHVWELSQMWLLR